MTKRIGIGLAALAVLVVAAVGITLAAGGSGDGGGAEATITDPHGATIKKSTMDRVLLAAEGASADMPKAELEAEGEKLFNSSTLAKPGESCASCHITGGGVNAKLGVITHPVPNGDNDFVGFRDAPSLWDVGETAPYNWVGGNKTLESQAVAAITTHFIEEGDAATGENVAAMTAFLRTIKAPASRQDQGRLTEKELHGEEMFVGKGGCIACHGGPQFTDNIIHPTGVPKRPGDTDMGDPNFKTPDNQFGGFNTPHLRGIKDTGPYMHNGIFDTLEEVVDFYNLNEFTGGPLRLTAEEKEALVAYLKAL